MCGRKISKRTPHPKVTHTLFNSPFLECEQNLWIWYDPCNCANRIRSEGDFPVSMTYLHNPFKSREFSLSCDRRESQRLKALLLTWRWRGPHHKTLEMPGRAESLPWSTAGRQWSSVLHPQGNEFCLQTMNWEENRKRPVETAALDNTSVSAQ